MEFESRIDVDIDLITYNRLKQDTISTCVLFYYNDGTRFSNNRFERKTRVAHSAFLQLANKLPIVRTISKEELVAIPSTWYLMKKAIYRHVLVDSNNIRIAVEQHLLEDRVEFHFTAEVEYESTSSFNSINDKEHDLVTAILPFKLMPVIEPVDTHIILNAPSRLFSLFSKHELGTDNIFITYKFDGYKVKMVNIAPNVILYYDDLKVLKKIDSSMLNAYPQLICQFERLATHLVLTDIIGYFYKNHWYMPEPLEALKFMKNFDTTQSIDNLTVIAQKPINVQSIQVPQEYSELKNDGMIVYADNKIYKYKWPTMDLVCKKKQLVLPNGAIYSAFANTRLKDDTLYEIDISNNTVIRQRNDRSLVHADTSDQIDLLIKETDFFKRLNGTN